MKSYFLDVEYLDWEINSIHISDRRGTQLLPIAETLGGNACILLLDLDIWFKVVSKL